MCVLPQPSRVVHPDHRFRVEPASGLTHPMAGQRFPLIAYGAWSNGTCQGVAPGLAAPYLVSLNQVSLDTRIQINAEDDYIGAALSNANGPAKWRRSQGVTVIDPSHGFISFADAPRVATGINPKASWVTRRLPEDSPLRWAAVGDPQIGDVLLCEVLRPGLHGRIETSTGERSKLYVGDLIICALGRRYATGMLEASAELCGEEADLVSASGVCGRVLQRTNEAVKPTRLRVLAQAVGATGRPLNLRSYGPEPAPPSLHRPAWILVVGSAMDSGKTTACAGLIHGLARAGMRVGAAKLTGTSSARDSGSYRDAGADPVFEFLDCGWPSTAGCTIEELDAIVCNLSGHLRAARVDAAVLEVADGLLQPETAALLELLRERLETDTAVFAARESLSAVAGVERLQRLGYDVAAVSGVVSISPLARREVELACSVPCLTTTELGLQATSISGLTASPQLREIGRLTG